MDAGRLGTREAAIDARRTLARDLLGRALGFRDCPAPLLARLVDASQIRTYGAGEWLGRRGDPFGHLGIVLDGVLDVGVTRADGHRPLVGLFRRGDVLGILELIDRQGMANDIVARSVAVIALIPSALLRDTMAVEPSLALACARQCAFRSRSVYTRLTMQDGSVETRVASILCILAQRYGATDGSTIRVDVRLPQSDLADWTGASRQRVNAALRHLAADGLVSLGYAAVTVTDMKRLQARVQG